MNEIDTGDVVLHGPTRERWTVACVEGERLSWCGWPEGMAKLSDCTLMEKATPEAKLALLRQLASMHHDDHRRRYALRVLETNHEQTEISGQATHPIGSISGDES